MHRHRVSRVLTLLIVGAAVSLAPPAARAQPAVDVPLFRLLARQQTPTVVAIRTTKWLDAGEEDAALFERLFARAFPSGLQRHREVGSGVLVSADGEILTNDHVVADADVIDVQLLGGETRVYRAVVIGRDPVSDSALIKLVNAPTNLPVAILGDSNTIESGDWVMTIGNPYQLGHSVSVGVISYTRRNVELQDGRWQALIQTDASINPGSSGGPLLNSQGEVIGLSYAVVADALGDSMGIGFAIPINTVKAVLPQLRSGRVVRGSLGVHPRMARLTDDEANTLGLPAPRGALIASIDPASSAEAAGLQAGDVVVEFLGAPIETSDDLVARVALSTPSSRARVVVLRDGRTQAMEVVVQASTSPEPRTPHDPPTPPTTFGLTLVGARNGDPVVREVEPGSPADGVGIEPGDVLRKINASVVRTVVEAQHALRRVVPGRTVFLIISREGSEQLVELRPY